MKKIAAPLVEAKKWRAKVLRAMDVLSCIETKKAADSYLELGLVWNDLDTVIETAEEA